MSEQRERTHQEAANERTIIEFESDARAKAQARIDFWVEQKLRDAEYDRELRARLDPFGYGHWD